MTRIGIIADTHGHLDPRVEEVFAGVDHILHAGDIGFASIVVELGLIAPTTAVLGNNDMGLHFRETEVLELGGRKLLLHHIVNPHAPSDAIARRIARDRPDIVVFGHTHRRFCETLGGVLYLNPGYAGRPRFNQPRSVAVLNLNADGVTVEFSEL